MKPPSQGRIAIASLAFVFAAATASRAQFADPRAFGLELPTGKIVAGTGERVVTNDDEGNAIVAKVHVRVGDAAVVMLPDGQLAARTASAITHTDRPFEPATMDDIAARLTAGDFAGFKTMQTRRYLYVYNTSETFALATSRVLETMFPGVVAYAESQKIPVHAPEVPMVVIMFRTEAEFQQHRRMPPGIVAYYNTLSNRVVMREESALAGVKPELAIQQSLATIAHEGAHQILNNIGVQQRLAIWPIWLVEGLAEFFAPTSTDKWLKWKGAGQVNDMRMFELEQYIKGHSGEQPTGRLVEHTVVAARLTSTGYATSWALTHYLAKYKREAFHAYVREISATGPLEGAAEIVEPGIVPEQLTAFRQHFGEDLPDLEGRVIAHLNRLPYRDPFAEWPHFVALVAYPNGRKTQREANVFHSTTLAEQWQRDVLARVADDIRPAAQSSIRPFPNRAAAELFARQWLQGR